MAEVLLFLLPIGIFVLWRRLNPGIEPGPRLTLALLAGVGLALLMALWWGFSRSMDRDSRYVAPRFEDGRLVPGHAEPRR